jgi:hypothetical protein
MNGAASRRAVRTNNQTSVTSMSAKLRISSTRRENGRTVKERKTLTATKVRAAKKEEAQRHADRRAGKQGFFLTDLTAKLNICLYSYDPS